MNLSVIIDGKSDYMKLSDINSDNFYFRLGKKIVEYLTPQNKEGKLSTEWNILGNKIKFNISSKSVDLFVDNKKYSSEPTLKGLEDVLYQVFQDDLKGNIEVIHPLGNAALERRDFNKAKGTVFPKLYKSVAVDPEGKRNLEVKGSRNNAPALTLRQFENASKVKSFNKDLFEISNTSGPSFYRNINSDVVELKSLYKDSPKDERTPSISDLKDILIDMENNVDYWARTPGLYQTYLNIKKYKTTILVYKDSVWFIIPTDSSYRIERFI